MSDEIRGKALDDLVAGPDDLPVSTRLSMMAKLSNRSPLRLDRAEVRRIFEEAARLNQLVVELSPDVMAEVITQLEIDDSHGAPRPAEGSCRAIDVSRREPSVSPKLQVGFSREEMTLGELSRLLESMVTFPS